MLSFDESYLSDYFKINLQISFESNFMDWKIRECHQFLFCDAWLKFIKYWFLPSDIGDFNSSYSIPEINNTK